MYAHFCQFYFDDICSYIAFVEVIAYCSCNRLLLDTVLFKTVAHSNMNRYIAAVFQSLLVKRFVAFPRPMTYIAKEQLNIVISTGMILL